MPKIKASIEESQMIPLIKEHVLSQEKMNASTLYKLYYPIVSTVDDSYRFTSTSITIENSSTSYHQLIETLLEKVPQGALIEGAISFIPPQTHLIGFTISHSIGFVNLSKEFLDETTLETTYERRVAQIKKNLIENYSLRDVVILVEGEILTTK